ncbi:putative glycosyltransferase, TIGR04372 family [Verrucomicrobium sp. GAS474]|uniref:TIGR04372 family glycosyltransferase n=1 Tax=Verrucomicrobium sp. GAS474 TaxID=1882831 RepID=UPI00087D5931|nr:TIGR04372 family glycosyltransferase [Verrucomicrobium sp. GAS474]SDT94517.1 putative glycosyltransferase, TIGR04372 family [Verrucomicrobium sp. GAS474]
MNLLPPFLKSVCYWTYIKACGVLAPGLLSEKSLQNLAKYRAWKKANPAPRFIFLNLLLRAFYLRRRYYTLLAKWVPSFLSAQEFQQLAQYHVRRGHFPVAAHYFVETLRKWGLGDSRSGSTPFFAVAQGISATQWEAIKSRWLAKESDFLSLYNQLGNALYLGGSLQKATACWATGLAVQGAIARHVGADRLDVKILSNSPWVQRIGLIGLLDSYVKMGLLGLRDNQNSILVERVQDISNPHLLGYFSKHIKWIQDPRSILSLQAPSLLLREPFHVIETGGEIRSIVDAAARAQILWEKQGNKPLLQLSEMDRAIGIEKLKRMGLPENAWYVCLHIREENFPKEGEGGSRNNVVQSDQKIIDEVRRRGGWIIRFGDSRMPAYADSDHLIDYNFNRVKSSEMDVFLCAHCRCYIGGNSELGLASAIFGVPTVLVDWHPLRARPWYSNQIFIPKLMRNIKENRFLTLEEMLQEPVDILESPAHLRAADIELMANSSEEILEVTVEMLDLLENFGGTSSKRTTRQQKFQDIAEANGSMGLGVLGDCFLQRHPQILDFSQKPHPLNFDP